METQTEEKKKQRQPATCVKFSSQEFAVIQKARQVTGKSLPDLLKGAFFKRVDLLQPLMTEAQVNEVIVALRRAGNNLNQVTKQINSGTMTGWSQSFNALVREYFQIRQMISVNRGNGQG